jgi:hypothetical protein
MFELLTYWSIVLILLVPVPLAVIVWRKYYKLRRAHRVGTKSLFVVCMTILTINYCLLVFDLIANELVGGVLILQHFEIHTYVFIAISGLLSATLVVWSIIRSQLMGSVVTAFAFSTLLCWLYLLVANSVA